MPQEVSTAKAFIWQGNPRRWYSSGGMNSDIEHKSKYIYWSTPQRRDEIQVGDKAYIWRTAGAPGDGPRGIIATGTVAETPQDSRDPKSQFKHPERLGPGTGEEAASSRWKTGISIAEVRLGPETGMLTVEMLHSVCPDLSILQNARGTVFRINAEQCKKLGELWARNRR
jgi:hypothetical protein